jgi:hypothetical protein
LYKLILGVALYLLAAGAAAAQDKGAAIVTAPAWDVRPTPESMEHHYPPLAAMFAIPEPCG